MEIFNVGIGELLIVVVIMYIFLGPQGMVRAMHWFGHTSRQIYRFFTESWREISDTPMDFRDLPGYIIRESGLQEPLEEIQRDARTLRVNLEGEIGQIDPRRGSAKGDMRTGALDARLPDGPAQPEDAAAAAVYADKYDLKITPARGAVQAEPPKRIGRYAPPVEPPEGQPDGGAPAADPAGAETVGAEGGPARRRRGRPRKDAPPPEALVKTPKKRGRPFKNRPEAGGAAAGAPVKERPSQPASRLPQQAPSQPGDAPMPLDLDEASSGAERAHPGQPAQGVQPAPRREQPSHPLEENPDHHAV